MQGFLRINTVSGSGSITCTTGAMADMEEDVSIVCLKGVEILRQGLKQDEESTHHCGAMLNILYFHLR